MVRPAAKREAVARLKERFQMSERRACAVIEADRKMIRYQSRRPAGDGATFEAAGFGQ